MAEKRLCGYPSAVGSSCPACRPRSGPPPGTPPKSTATTGPCKCVGAPTLCSKISKWWPTKPSSGNSNNKKTFEWEQEWQTCGGCQHTKKSVFYVKFNVDGIKKNYRRRNVHAEDNHIRHCNSILENSHSWSCAHSLHLSHLAQRFKRARVEGV